MIEYVADRYEDGALVCFAESAKQPDGSRLTGDPMNGGVPADSSRLSLPCPAIPRSEGRRVLLFEALCAQTPYVFIPGAISAPDGKAALILPPDVAREAAVRSRFDKIFKKST